MTKTAADGRSADKSGQHPVSPAPKTLAEGDAGSRERMDRPAAAHDELLYLAEIHEVLRIPISTMQRWHSEQDPRCAELGLHKALNGRLMGLRSKVDAHRPRR
jgi:hypothetical protein